MGYADAMNIWYHGDTTNTVFWIDSDGWNVCKPFLSENDHKNTDNMTQCNDALIVTRIDRDITAIDMDSDDPLKSTRWRFKHGEYRVATKQNMEYKNSEHQKFIYAKLP